MDAVRQAGSTTYKQVAHIVSKNVENQQFFASNSSSSKSEAQQEKNLRRRVYDSLNVLYAVGVLQKGCQKTVYCGSQDSADSQNQEMQFELESRREETNRAKQRLLQKRHRLLELMRSNVSC